MALTEIIMRADALRHCVFWVEGMPFDAELGKLNINNTHYDFASAGIIEWFYEYQKNWDSLTEQENPDFNLSEWNKRGLIIAKDIAGKLPPDIELYYQSPKNVNGTYIGECIKVV